MFVLWGGISWKSHKACLENNTSKQLIRAQSLDLGMFFYLNKNGSVDEKKTAINQF